MRTILAVAHVTASAATRTIEGVATIYGERANASSGPVTFARGSLRWADDVSRVKLLVDHDMSRPVGYATALVDEGDQLRATFYVPPGEAGDVALTEAANGLRDGLSVGVWADDDGYTFDDDYAVTITSGTVREVTLCAVPAFDDARLTDVAATIARHKEGTPVTQPAPVVEATPASTPPAPAPAPAPAPVVEATPAPQAPPVQVVERAGVVTLRQAAELISRTYRMGGGAADVRAALGITAALADVIPTDFPTGADPYLRPTWLGEVWTASKTVRPFIDLFGGSKPLTSTKIEGWVWDVKPQVVTYPGNKAAVTGNKVKTKLVSTTPERTAGGWDVDRIYVDLGTPGLIESLFEMAVEDYRRKSETKFVSHLLAGASTVTAQPSLPAALGALGVAAARLGATVSGVGFGADVWAGLLELRRDEVPWWMGNGASINLGTNEGDVGGMRLFVSADLADDQVLAGDSRGATFYEVDPPVRVQALDIANGGVDLGVFGYQADLINDARAIIKTTVTPPAPEA